MGMVSATKARQADNIGEIADALVSVGYVTLDQQAKALGLSRSTAWTVLRPSHKASGLTISVINRMLAAPELPQLVREKINEYVQKRLAGVYGHNRMQLRRFAGRLSEKIVPTVAEQIKWLLDEPGPQKETPGSRALNHPISHRT